MGPHGRLWGQARLGASRQGATVGRRLQSVSGSERGKKRGISEGSCAPPGISEDMALPVPSSMPLPRAGGRTASRSQLFSCYSPNCSAAAPHPLSHKWTLSWRQAAV